MLGGHIIQLIIGALGSDHWLSAWGGSLAVCQNQRAVGDHWTLHCHFLVGKGLPKAPGGAETWPHVLSLGPEPPPGVGGSGCCKQS